MTDPGARPPGRHEGCGQRTDPHDRAERSELAGTLAELLGCHERVGDLEVEPEDAHGQGDRKQEPKVGAAPDVPDRRQHSAADRRLGCRPGRLDPWQTEQAGDLNHERNCIDDEDRAGADQEDQRPGRARSQEPRRVEARAVEADGVGDGVARYEFGDDGLPAGAVEGSGDTVGECEGEDVPELHRARQRQRGQENDVDEEHDLRDEHDAPLGESVGQRSRDGCEQQGR